MIDEIVQAVARGPLAGFLHARVPDARGREIAHLGCRDHIVLEAASPGRPAYVYAIYEVAYRDDRNGEASVGDLYGIPLVIGTGGACGPDAVIGVVEHDGKPVTIADGVGDDRLARSLLAMIARGTTLPSERGGAIVPTQGPTALAGLLGGDAIEELALRRLRSDASVGSRHGGRYDQGPIVVSPGGHDRIVLKVLRRLERGVSPEVEMGIQLARVGFRAAPMHLGHLSYVPPASQGETEPITLALAQQYLMNGGDAWSQALAALRGRKIASAPGDSRSPGSDVEWPGLATRLGELTADLHLALAADRMDPAFVPEPMSDDELSSITTDVGDHLLHVAQTLEASMAGFADDVQSSARTILSRATAQATALRTLRLSQPLTKTRIHGDLHLGQMLRLSPDAAGRDQGFAVVDFRGERNRPLSRRREKTLALRDVAGVTRSFDYATFAYLRESAADGVPPEKLRELERRAIEWRDAARGAFVEAWIDRLRTGGGAAVVAPGEAASRDRMLALFELDRALYELEYEMSHRPEWIAIPLRGIERTMAAQASSG